MSCIEGKGDGKDNHCLSAQNAALFVDLNIIKYLLVKHEYSLTVTGENIIDAVPKMQNNSATIKLFIFAISISKQQYWIYSMYCSL